MRMMKGNRGLWTLGATAVAAFMLAGVASADVTIEQSGSIVVWPKVVWDGTRDTIIEIANTGNPMAHAHCFYVNAAPVNPNFPPSATNPPQWIETDFDVWLSRQQPTHWVASLGRKTNFFDDFGSDGAGLDPGLIPPVPLGFQGELKCIQVNEDGLPFPGNKLQGQATLRRSDGDVSQYDAIALPGNPSLSGDAIGNDLQLTLTDANPDGEYSACPDTLVLNHVADGATDLVLDQLGACDPQCFGGPTPGATCNPSSNAPQCGAGGRCLTCPVTTTLTLVPCSEDFENQIPGNVTVSFQIWNEFEQPFSTSTTVSCWLNAPINTLGSGTVFTFNVLGSFSAHSRINPNPGNGGVIGVAEELRRVSATDPGAAADYAIHTEGNRFDAATDGKGNSVAGVTDHIVVPAQ